MRNNIHHVLAGVSKKKFQITEKKLSPHGPTPNFFKKIVFASRALKQILSFFLFFFFKIFKKVYT